MRAAQCSASRAASARCVANESNTPMTGAHRTSLDRVRRISRRWTGSRPAAACRRGFLRLRRRVLPRARPCCRRCRAAQGDYPNRPIRIIVPYPAGGIVDIVARAVTEQVGRDLKRDHRHRGSTGRRRQYRRRRGRAASGGYASLVTGPRALVDPTLYKDAGWDALKDLRCVGLAVWNSKRRTGSSVDAGQHHQEFVEIARESRRTRFRQSRHRFLHRSERAEAVSGQPTSSSADVGYKGQPPALIDLMTNLMHLEIVSLDWLPHIKAGSVKPLA